MRTALLLTAALFARTAAAQPGAQDPAPAPTPAPTPAPQPDTGPVPPPNDAPKVDPAYGARPDHTVEGAPSDRPGVRRGRDIVVRYTPNRSKQNITLIASIAGAAVVMGAVGLYFHFDANSAAEEVAAKTFTGRAWTSDRQEAYDTAQRSSTIAGVMYGIGGALLLSTAIVFIATEPERKEIVITPHSGTPKPTAMLAPTRGGAIVGGTWRW